MWETHKLWCYSVEKPQNFSQSLSIIFLTLPLQVSHPQLWPGSTPVKPLLVLLKILWYRISLPFNSPSKIWIQWYFSVHKGQKISLERMAEKDSHANMVFLPMDNSLQTIESHMAQELLSQYKNFCHINVQKVCTIWCNHKTLHNSIEGYHLDKVMPITQPSNCDIDQ